jgi:predicted O-methyltransferase YrrM
MSPGSPVARTAFDRYWIQGRLPNRVKRIIVCLLEALLKPLVLLGAPVFYAVARTGIGADICQRFGFLPIRVHFYQPIPKYTELPEGYFDLKQSFPGFAINKGRMAALLEELGHFAGEIDWPEHAAAEGRYFWANPNFGYSSAALLYTIIRRFQPRRVVEVGGGYSSLVALGALSKRSSAEGFHFASIEPFPPPWLDRALTAQSTRAVLIRSMAQQVALDTFLELEENDILFIDSSHVSKLGSDVNFLLLQVLPRLKPGVLVHIHDIYLPYEYPRVHFFGRNKLFWNEQYLLSALLTDNPKIEILLPGYLAQRDMEKQFAEAFPGYDAEKHRRTSSFWIRRI